MMDDYFLVNLVHNDFQDREAIFRPFFADAGLKLNGDEPALKLNGDITALKVNGDAHPKAIKA
ncbi:hypothetical protein FRC12_024057 [Ceratobasidium sp. 428]|nr:hypothetical protein FRC12_024057 [Ceratobasidium sp. 428]